MKKIITKYVAIYSFIIILITGCGNQNEAKDLNGMFSTNIIQIIDASDSNIIQKLGFIKNSISSSMDNYVKPEDRLMIDYPFRDSLENYSLCLLPINGTEDEYKLVLYDSDTIIQELPCGKISGTPEFSFDDVYSGNDLEIFFYDEEIDEWKGLLFQWDWQKNDRFVEYFIKIPKYDEIASASAHRKGILSVINDNDSVMENTLFEVSDDIKSTVEIRKWTFEKDTKLLKIYDCLEDKIIFEGNVTLDKDNNIVNDEYYQYLFLYEIPPIRNYESDENINLTNDETYPNKHEFLSHYGFDNEEEPFYQCYDVFGNLMIELYFDEETETGCGIRYETFYNSNLEKKATMSGFSFSSLENRKWTDPETYALKPYGKTDNVKEIDGIENYEESVEYLKDRRPDYFQSQGIVSWLGDDSTNEIATILTINFIYRNDGTLFYKYYSHNPFVFETTKSTMHIYYDELERIKYESDYVTHGHLEYYYIYKNNDKNPSYCLGLDYSHGYDSFFIEYE